MSDTSQLKTARAVFAQLNKDCQGARGSIWGYLFLVFVGIIALGFLLLPLLYALNVMPPTNFLAESVSSAAKTSKAFDHSIQAVGLLVSPFIAGASWVCVSHLRGGSVGAWTAIKRAAKRYFPLLTFKVINSGIVWAISALGLFISHVLATKAGTASSLGSYIKTLFGIASFVLLIVCLVFWMYVYPMLLETKLSLIEIMKRSWRCVRKHKQFWLVVRTGLLLMACFVSAIFVTIALPFSLGAADWTVKLLGAALAAFVLVWAYPYLVMFPNTFYCRFFNEMGEMISEPTDERTE